MVNSDAKNYRRAVAQGVGNPWVFGSSEVNDVSQPQRTFGSECARRATLFAACKKLLP
jgi:hypothetical protein